MKKLLVIADLPNPANVYKLLDLAIGRPTLPKDVLRLADNSWLIDVHKSLPFFASLVHTAQQQNVPLVVLPTDDDVIVLSPPPPPPP
jgi:hypothetical protein